MRPIPGYLGRYSATDSGAIYSHISGRFLKLISSGHGYLKVSLNNPRKHMYVHRLVLSAYKGDSELHCNHINGIKDDNRLENLEYCTASENMKHASTTGLRKYTTIFTKDNIKIVECLRSFNWTQQDIADVLEVQQSTISRYLRTI